MLGRETEKEGRGGNQMGVDEEWQNSEQIRKIGGEKNKSQESCSRDRKARAPWGRVIESGKLQPGREGKGTLGKGHRVGKAAAGTGRQGDPGEGS